MAIGEFGLLLEFAVSLAEEEFKLTPEFATTQHPPIMVPHAWDLLLKVLHVTHNHAILVSRNESLKKIILLLSPLLAFLLSFLFLRNESH
jgi:hypothetical protein